MTDESGFVTIGFRENQAKVAMELLIAANRGNYINFNDVWRAVNVLAPDVSPEVLRMLVTPSTDEWDNSANYSQICRVLIERLYRPGFLDLSHPQKVAVQVAGRERTSGRFV
jgi:hypothetical protein